MSSSIQFWRRLFSEGSITLDGPPQGNSSADRDVRSLLSQCHKNHALTVAGPPLPFVEAIAIRAAHIVERSAWYLVTQAGTEDDLERDLAFPIEPREPADHLSADLTFQYLPSIYQRARVLYPADRLPALLAEILRRWPLSGVLAEWTDAPTGDLNFGGHPGLLLLYAERLAAHFKPAWIPPGPGMPYLELVWTEMGRDPTLLAGAQRAKNGTEEPDS